MKDDINYMLGKTIRSIIVNEDNESEHPTLIFFVFDDDTSYGFAGNIFSSGKVEMGGEKSVIEYARMLYPKGNPKVYSLEPLQDEQDKNGLIPDLAKLTRSLLDFGETIPTSDLFPTVVQEAAEIVSNDPYAFSIACCLDRGSKADIIWTIPYDIKNDLGHLDPFKI